MAKNQLDSATAAKMESEDAFIPWKNAKKKKAGGKDIPEETGKGKKAKLFKGGKGKKGKGGNPFAAGR